MRGPRARRALMVSSSAGTWTRTACSGTTGATMCRESSECADKQSVRRIGDERRASALQSAPERSRGCHTGATHRTDQSPLHRHPAQISPPGNREGRLNLPVDRSARGPSAPKTQSDVCRQTTDGSMDSTRNPLDLRCNPRPLLRRLRLLRSGTEGRAPNARQVALDPVENRLEVVRRRERLKE